MELAMTQIYVGSGRGKTTSAIGQGIRAVGAGKKVHMIQFLLKQCSSEASVLKRLEPDFKEFCFEKQKGPYETLTEIQKEELKNELQNTYNFAKKVLETKQCDLLILDEILTVVSHKLISEEQVIQLVKQKPDTIELVLTGISCSQALMDLVDYVTEIKTIKNPDHAVYMLREGLDF